MPKIAENVQIIEVRLTRSGYLHSRSEQPSQPYFLRATIQRVELVAFPAARSRCGATRRVESACDRSGACPQPELRAAEHLQPSPRGGAGRGWEGRSARCPRDLLLQPVAFDPLPVRHSPHLSDPETAAQVKLTRREVFIRDNFTCQYCGRRDVELTIDHVVPRSRGVVIVGIIWYLPARCAIIVKAAGRRSRRG